MKSAGFELIDEEGLRNQWNSKASKKKPSDSG